MYVSCRAYIEYNESISNYNKRTDRRGYLASACLHVAFWLLTQTAPGTVMRMRRPSSSIHYISGKCFVGPGSGRTHLVQGLLIGRACVTVTIRAQTPYCAHVYDCLTVPVYVQFTPLQYELLLFHWLFSDNAAAHWRRIHVSFPAESISQRCHISAII